MMRNLIIQIGINQPRGRASYTRFFKTINKIKMTEDDIYEIFNARTDEEREREYVETEALFWDHVNAEAKRIINDIDIMEIIFAEISDGDDTGMSIKGYFKRTEFTLPNDHIEVKHPEIIKRISTLTGCVYIDTGLELYLKYESYTIFFNNKNL